MVLIIEVANYIRKLHAHTWMILQGGTAEY